MPQESFYKDSVVGKRARLLRTMIDQMSKK
jgi:hypothetical protein